MPAQPVIRATIDATTKREASRVLAEIGMTPASAFRLMMARVAAEKALPFEPLIPGPETIAAMEAARRGETIKSGGDLLASLDAED